MRGYYLSAQVVHHDLPAAILTESEPDPFVVIRSISDHADEDSVEAFESNVETVSLNSLALVECLLVGLQSSLP
ncbi:hypothetical protein GC101_07455 [Paenibacillus sp. LMG 31459]|uniref:Uncharacterized protein n=1 Tax=Paenibacillus phytohabitans TaxID=2654978 RepID=A0ABX1YCL3_9BACL|nr:hypothetical protein [Paenibacillus phytohabitans]NOU78718.1 hypothetical protein [Paenibacillus phytohabitans]